MLKTLVVLTPGFPENDADSTCMPDRQQFVRVLKEQNPELNLIVLTFHYPFTRVKYSWNGIQVIALGGKDKGRVYRGITWLRAWHELKKLNAQYPSMGLLSFWLGECAFVANRFAKKHRLQHYCWLLGQDAKPGNKYVNLIKPDGKTLIALSDFIIQEFNKNYQIKPENLLPGAINTKLFKAMPPVKDIDIIGAGSLIPLKQYSLFVDIIGALKVDFPNIKAVLCGGGPEIEMLQHKINELGLENNLTLTGKLPHDQVLTLMQRSKVFLHTSNYEGFGIVCLEALYAGAKVVSFVKPMYAAIANWQIAKDPQQMQHLASAILKSRNISYQPVAPFLLSDNAQKLMKLFA